MTLLSDQQKSPECPSCGEAFDPDFLIPAGDTHICPICRESYQQRLKEGVPVDQQSDWVALREAHIKHEASLRSVGFLFYLGGFVVISGFVAILFAVLGAAEAPPSSSPDLIFGGFYALLGVALFFVGRGYRTLKPWVKIPGAFFAIVGLLGFPLGTLINGYILYLLFSEKGKMVLSSEYAAIREATPDVKYRTSALVWAFIGLLILLFLFALLAPVLAKQ